MALIYLVERLGTIFEMSITLSTAVDGPLVSFFVLGVLMPWIGKKGAVTGGCVSLVFMIWLIGGMQWHIFNKHINSVDLPSSTENCPFPINGTLQRFHETTTSPSVAPEDEAWQIFKISMFYLNFTGALIAIIVANITSFITGETNMTNVNPQHVSFLVRRYFYSYFYKMIYQSITDKLLL